MTTMQLGDRWALACNYHTPTGVASTGAAAYIILSNLGGNLPERVQVLVRSRGRRWVAKWENARRLGNFRLKTLPPQHPRYDDERINWATEEDLARMRWAESYLREKTVASS